MQHYFITSLRINYLPKILKIPNIPSLPLLSSTSLLQKRRYTPVPSFSPLWWVERNKYKLKRMAEPSFYMNQDESMGCQEHANSDWFGEGHYKCNPINLPHYTFEVPEEMLPLRNPTTDPVKPDPIESISTGKGLFQEENMGYALEPISSQIQFPSSQQEEVCCRRGELEEEFFPDSGENHLQTRQGAQTRNGRVILQISRAVFNHRTATEKGKRFETKNLCKHIHSETMRHLKKLHTIHQFDLEETQQVKLFCRTKASIDNFKELFRNLKIANLCREFYESPEFVKEILTSKMEMGSKLTILKYLKKMRKLTHDVEFKAWKKEPM